MSDILTLCECPLALCEWPFELCECLLSYVGDLLSYASDLLSCVSDLLSYVSDPHSEQLSLWQCPVSMVEQEGGVLLQWMSNTLDRRVGRRISDRFRRAPGCFQNVNVDELSIGL